MNYTSSNRLQLNSDKTHFFIIATPQKRRTFTDNIKVKFGNDIVEESCHVRSLGVQVSNVLGGWGYQIDGGNKSVLIKCGSILNDLQKLGKYMSFKRPLHVGKLLYMSKLLFGVEVWGPGATKGQNNTLQSSQNKLIRWITQKKYESPDAGRKTCNLLSVYQYIVLKILNLGLSVLHFKRPENLYASLRGDDRSGGKIIDRPWRNILSQESYDYYQRKSWKNFFIIFYNKLPADLKSSVPRKSITKTRLKEWVRVQVPASPVTSR